MSPLDPFLHRTRIAYFSMEIALRPEIIPTAAASVFSRATRRDRQQTSICRWCS
jgi:hypothetical protein